MAGPAVTMMTRHSTLGASSRYRSYQFLPYLRRHGLEPRVVPFFTDDDLRRVYTGASRSWPRLVAAYGRRAAALLDRAPRGVLFFEKELLPLLPAFVELPLARRWPAIVVDLDDAVFHNYDLAASPLVRALLGSKIDRLMASATLTIAGNEYIARRAAAAGARWIEVVPSCVDLSAYDPPVGGRATSALEHPPGKGPAGRGPAGMTSAAAPESSGAPFTVGWIGTPVTSRYLHIVTPVVRRLAAEAPIRLLLIGGRGEAMEGVTVETRPWSQQTEVADLEECDVGIMPLTDSPFERGKCGLKLIQYMACRKPVVASPVGVNSDLVEPGVNGYLAETAEQWLAALRALRDSGELRSRLGEAGRRKVERSYSLQVAGPRLAELLLEAARRAGVR